MAMHIWTCTFLLFFPQKHLFSLQLLEQLDITLPLHHSAANGLHTTGVTVHCTYVLPCHNEQAMASTPSAV